MTSPVAPMVTLHLKSGNQSLHLTVDATHKRFAFDSVCDIFQIQSVADRQLVTAILAVGDPPNCAQYNSFEWIRRTEGRAVKEGVDISLNRKELFDSSFEVSSIESNVDRKIRVFTPFPGGKVLESDYYVTTSSLKRSLATPRLDHVVASFHDAETIIKLTQIVKYRKDGTEFPGNTHTARTLTFIRY